MAEQGHPDGEEGTEAYFALIYDRALLSEEAQETDKALSLFREIQSWNPVYRGHLR